MTLLLFIRQTKTQNIYMKNKLLSLASLLAVFNANAIEIGPTGSGVEMSGFRLFIRKRDLGAGMGASRTKLSFLLGLSASGVRFWSISKTDQTIEVTYDFGSGFSVTAGKCLLWVLKL